MEYFVTKLKIHHRYSLITTHNDFGSMIVAVYRMPVTYRLNKMTLLSMSSLSSEDSASTLLLFEKSLVCFPSGTFFRPTRASFLSIHLSQHGLLLTQV